MTSFFDKLRYDGAAEGRDRRWTAVGGRIVWWKDGAEGARRGNVHVCAGARASVCGSFGAAVAVRLLVCDWWSELAVRPVAARVCQSVHG